MSEESKAVARRWFEELFNAEKSSLKEA